MGEEKDKDTTALSAAVSEADRKFTPLLLKTAIPLMGVTSSLFLEVSFCVLRLNPVNWIVAPRSESTSEPVSPAARPVQDELFSFWCIYKAQSWNIQAV